MGKLDTLRHGKLSDVAELVANTVLTEMEMQAAMLNLIEQVKDIGRIVDHINKMDHVRGPHE